MLASIVLFSTLYATYSAYNGTSIVKRVVSTQATSTKVFSSNYLEDYSNTNIAVKDLRTTTEGNFVMAITVCNYDQMDFNSYAKSNIEYELKAELVQYNSTTGEYVLVREVQKEGTGEEARKKKFTVKRIMDNNAEVEEDERDLNTGSFTVLFNESLEGGNPLKDAFEICFDSAEVVKAIPDLFIRVIATPTPESQQLNPGISTMACIISISQGRTVETGWHGSLQENGNEEYDGYNLIIEGSGAGTIEILWNNNLFAMNPAFDALYGSSGSNILGPEIIPPGKPSGWIKRTLTVNSMVDNRYVVQFYKKQPAAVGTGNIECDNYTPQPVEEP